MSTYDQRPCRPIPSTPALIELWAELEASLPRTLRVAEAWLCDGRCGEAAHFIIEGVDDFAVPR